MPCLERLSQHVQRGAHSLVDRVREGCRNTRRRCRRKDPKNDVEQEIPSCMQKSPSSPGKAVAFNNTVSLRIPGEKNYDATYKIFAGQTVRPRIIAYHIAKASSLAAASWTNPDSQITASYSLNDSTTQPSSLQSLMPSPSIPRSTIHTSSSPSGQTRPISPRSTIHTSSSSSSPSGQTRPISPRSTIHTSSSSVSPSGQTLPISPRSSSPYGQTRPISPGSSKPSNLPQAGLTRPKSPSPSKLSKSSNASQSGLMRPSSPSKLTKLPNQSHTGLARPSSPRHTPRTRPLSASKRGQSRPASPRLVKLTTSPNSIKTVQSRPPSPRPNRLKIPSRSGKSHPIGIPKPSRHSNTARNTTPRLSAILSTIDESDSPQTGPKPTSRASPHHNGKSQLIHPGDSPDPEPTNSTLSALIDSADPRLTDPTRSISSHIASPVKSSQPAALMHTLSLPQLQSDHSQPMDRAVSDSYLN